MIRLFKTSRSGSNVNYFKYAFGEIALVVVGILLALQINNWNENRKNRIQESQILSQLQTEYKNNLDQLNSKIKTRNDIMVSSMKILSYRELKESRLNVDSLNLHLARTLTRPTFDPELGVTNELTNSGKLYYLTNIELRNSLASFSSFLSELREEEMVTFNLIEERYFPFLIENYQLGAVLANNMTDPQFHDQMMMIDVSRKELDKGLFVSDSPYQLINNRDMEDYMALMFTNTEYTNIQSEGVKSKIENILSLVRAEIEKTN